MKKLFAILLAVAMMATLALPTFALNINESDLNGGVEGTLPSTGESGTTTTSAETLTESPATGNGAGDYTIGVNGTYAAGANAKEVISADISWDAMDFTYDMGKGVYSATDHKMTYPNAAWSTNTADITVTNHSNTAISADFSFTAAEGIKGVLTKDSVIIESAEQEKYQTAGEDGKYPAPAASTSFSIDPTSTAISADATLGTITVTIAKYDGFVYDATGATCNTQLAALKAAVQTGETKLTILGDVDDYALVSALYSATENSIELTLTDVTSISEGLFKDQDEATLSLKTVTLPNATSIGKNAFYGCDRLTSVSAPHVTTVGKEAFYSCDRLSTVSMPECQTVESSAFRGCTDLKTVSLPKCKTVAGNAFSTCTSLESITLPEATSIGGFAFQGCTSLTSAELPKVTSVGYAAFQSCSNLNRVTFGTPITEWGMIVFGASNDYYKVDTENMTITFADGQKTFTGDDTDGWTITEDNLSDGTDVEFCGRTFGTVVISDSTT